MKIETYKEALEKVFIVEDTRDYSLERVKKAVEILGNPLKDIKVIHIAGTNGKGSTCKMCFSVLKHTGKRVGCFTSPHLIDIKERFITDEGEITEDEFVELLNRVLNLGLDLSFFEKATLMSFLFFEKRKVEYGVVEVGFGGLLDSTNVVEPRITAITSIGLDHVDFLGNTLDEISFQKAGIIKQGIPIIYNHTNKVIEKIAHEKRAPIIFTSKLVETNLVGKYQQRNASIAFEICKYLGIEDKLILEGLQKVEHFGRLQYVTKNLLIDGAHNEQGLKELEKYLQFIKQDFKEIKLCFSQKKGKNGSNILDTFGKERREFILIESSNTLMVESAEILKKKILENNSFSTEGFSPLDLDIKTSEEVYKLSQDNKNTLYVVFGSLYMIGEFLKFVGK